MRNIILILVCLVTLSCCNDTSNKKVRKTSTTTTELVGKYEVYTLVTVDNEVYRVSKYYPDEDVYRLNPIHRDGDNELVKAKYVKQYNPE